MKKVIIIGAGISGLSAGIYAQKNGYQAEIHELHSIAGGECTGWNRGKYYYDGCIHWLLGSREGTSLNNLWREVGALDDSVPIIFEESFGEYHLEGRKLVLYRDVERLREHLLELSPQDKKEILQLCKAIKGLEKMGMPYEKPYELMSGLDFMKLGFSMLPFMPYMKYTKLSIAEYVKRFKDPLLRQGLAEAVPSDYYAMALLSTLASQSYRDSGWPQGGSRPMAQRMEKRFLDLGGKIHLKSPVAELIIQENTAQGIRLKDGSIHHADYVVSTADGHHTLYDLLHGKYLSDVHHKMYTLGQGVRIHSSFQAWVGIAADLSQEPKSLCVDLSQPVTLGGKTFTRIGFKNYSYDPTLNPPGHSVVLATFMTDDFEWWEKLYQDRAAYLAEKRRIADAVQQAVEENFPAAQGKVENVNVATPMTYVRYCNAWRGAWMSWIATPDLAVRGLPMRLKGLNNFVMGGQWTMPPGGLPTALISGRWAIQHLSALDNKKFIGEK